MSRRERGLWFRFSVKGHKGRRVLELSSDAARWTWVSILCEAKVLEDQGVFHNLRHLRGVLPGRPLKHFRELLEVGLLVEREDGAIEVDLWEAWQSRPTGTGAERQRRYRDRQRELERARESELAGLRSQISELSARVGPSRDPSPNASDVTRRVTGLKTRDLNPKSRGCGNVDNSPGETGDPDSRGSSADDPQDRTGDDPRRGSASGPGSASWGAEFEEEEEVEISPEFLEGSPTQVEELILETSASLSADRDPEGRGQWIGENSQSGPRADSRA